MQEVAAVDDFLPTPHVLHVARDASSLYCPSEQSTHVVEADAPSDRVPGLQETQLPDPPSEA